MAYVEKTVEIPSDVEIVVDGRKVTARGPKGELTRDFSHSLVEISSEEGVVKVRKEWPRKKESAIVGTVSSLIGNMILGVKEGFTYKLKMVFAHFPVSVKTDQGRVVIENFAGQRRTIFVKIIGSSRVSVEGDDVIVQGINLEEVSQTAANIEQAARVRRKDPRVFLDGIYVYEKTVGM
jgi:large subunit ribosomal protein L6